MNRFQKHVEGYVPVKVTDKDGKKVTRYQYQGEYYYLDLYKISFQQAKLCTCLLGIASFLAMLLVSIVPCELNHIYYCGGFTFMALVPQLFVLIGGIRMITIKDDFTVQQYRECRNAVFYGSFLTFTLLLCSFVGTGIYGFQGNALSSECILVIVAEAAVFIAQFVIFILHNARNYHTRLKEAAT